MGTRTWGGENVLGANPGPEKSKKLTKQVIVIFIVWFVAMASLLGVHYLLKKRPQINKSGIQEIREKYAALNDQEKIRMKYFESGMIELANGALFVVDGNGQGEPEANGLVWRKIEFAIDDPLLLERMTMFKEAHKTLNNAERRCLVDRHAAIIHSEGEYYLVLDKKIYDEYVLRYGTECKSCGDKAKSIKNNDIGR